MAGFATTPRRGWPGASKLAPGAVIEVSGRLHRTERHYEYSYRVLSIASLGWKLR